MSIDYFDIPDTLVSLVFCIAIFNYKSVPERWILYSDPPYTHCYTIHAHSLYSSQAWKCLTSIMHVGIALLLIHTKTNVTQSKLYCCIITWCTYLGQYSYWYLDYLFNPGSIQTTEQANHFISISLLPQSAMTAEGKWGWWGCLLRAPFSQLSWEHVYHTELPGGKGEKRQSF